MAGTGRALGAGWTHASVAEMLHVERQSVTRWVTGVRYPEVRTMKRIEQYWGWPARDQIDLVPVEGYDMTYAIVFAEVLDEHYPKDRQRSVPLRKRPRTPWKNPPKQPPAQEQQ